MILMLSWLSSEDFVPKTRERSLNTLTIIPKPAYSVFKGRLAYPSFWPSFIEIGVMACITPTWCSHELCVNS